MEQLTAVMVEERRNKRQQNERFLQKLAYYNES